jgi:hypothetical protein
MGEPQPAISFGVLSLAKGSIDSIGVKREKCTSYLPNKDRSSYSSEVGGLGATRGAGNVTQIPEFDDSLHPSVKFPSPRHLPRIASCSLSRVTSRAAQAAFSVDPQLKEKPLSTSGIQ